MLLSLQAVVSVLGLVVSSLTLLDAIRKFYTLRAMQLNGPREALTAGTLLSEIGRVTIHLHLVAITGLFWLSGRPVPWTIGTVILLDMSVLLMLISLNSFITNQKVIRALSDGEPKL